MLSFGYGVMHRLDCFVRLGTTTTTTPFMVFSVTDTTCQGPKLDV